jgi:hypothetical protein
MEDPIIIENFIDQEDCSVMIDFMKNEEHKFKHTPIDGRYVMVNGDDQRIIYMLKKYTNKLRNIMPIYNDLYPHITYTFKYTTEVPLYMHSDVFWDECKDDPYVVVFYFNGDFEGNHLIIPSLDFEHKPKEGEIAMFYPDLIHGTTPMPSGKKYIMNVCFTPHKDRVYPQYLDI